MDTAPEPKLESTEKKKKDRNWTTQENSLFANLLADPQFRFVQSLESRAAKKQSNEDIFQVIAREMDVLVNSDHFRAYNEAENFLTKDGRILPYTTLDMDFRKLRYKYKQLKCSWGKICSNADKNGLEYLKRPEWYDALDPIFRQYRGKDADIDDCDIVIGVEPFFKDKNDKLHTETDKEPNSKLPDIHIQESVAEESLKESETQEKKNDGSIRTTFMNLLMSEEPETSPRSLESGTASKHMYDFLVQNKHAKVDETSRRAMSEAQSALSQSKRDRKSTDHRPKRPRLNNELSSNGEQARDNWEPPTPYHFVETLRVIIDSHRQQQSAWLERENRKEQTLLVREERSLAREKHFLNVLREEGEKYRQHQLQLTKLYTSSLTTLSNCKSRCSKCDSQIEIEDESQGPFKGDDTQGDSLRDTCNDAQTPDSQSCCGNDSK